MKSIFYSTFILAAFAFMAITSAYAQQPAIQHFRPYSQKGINVFEPTKDNPDGSDSLKVRLGGSFAQQFQALSHSNTADFKLQVVGKDSINANKLYDLDPGFNLATANMMIDVQLKKGVTVNLTTYLSSRHHPETWVKGGYLQVDNVEFLGVDFLNKIMNNMRVKVGHMEINYGDAHFRRSDNGNALYNPFIENYIIDAFTTEIGSEIYFFKKGFTVMGAMTNGLINGSITTKEKRNPAVYGKLSYDSQLSDDLRLRISGSFYHCGKSTANTLYAGDRTGSRYYMVMENTLASASANFTSGRFNPSFRHKVDAMMGNLFLKWRGLEWFNTIELSSGRQEITTTTGPVLEDKNRKWTQFATDVVYRFFDREQLFVGVRYNQVKGRMLSTTSDVSINRAQASLGWFVTPNILAKVEYVNQTYKDFASTDIRHGGKFKGFMLEGVISF